MTGSQALEMYTESRWSRGSVCRVTKRRKSYVKSEYGPFIHRTHGAIVGEHSELAVFECGEATLYPHYLDAVPRRRAIRRCKRCFA